MVSKIYLFSKPSNPQDTNISINPNSTWKAIQIKLILAKGLFSKENVFISFHFEQKHPLSEQ